MTVTVKGHELRVVKAPCGCAHMACECGHSAVEILQALDMSIDGGLCTTHRAQYWEFVESLTKLRDCDEPDYVEQPPL